MTEKFTCQFCGEVLPSADTFHDLVACYLHLKRRIAELEAENARLKEDRRWIPVSERLPEEGVVVLVANPQGDINKDFWSMSYPDFWVLTDPPRFWMPLPEPPEVTE